MPENRGERSLLEHVCCRANLEGLEADFRVVAAAQVGWGWKHANMARVSRRDGEEAAVWRDGKLIDVPRRREFEDLRMSVSMCILISRACCIHQPYSLAQARSHDRLALRHAADSNRSI